MKQIKNNNNKEIILTESKFMRDKYVENEEMFDILDKIKAIPYLTKDMVVTVEQVANYYEVSKKTINTIIERHRDELENDGIITLKGEELKSFKNELINDEISSKTTVLTILTKRAMLRIGMLLTTGAIAKEVRTYLLSCEEEIAEEKKLWLAKRQAGIIDRKRMTTAISNYVPEGKSKRFAYPNYTNMIYKVLFQKDAKSLKEERGYEKNEKLRDSFSGQELMLVDEAETIVTALVTLGFGYDYIKDQLEKKYTYLHQHKLVKN